MRQHLCLPLAFACIATANRQLFSRTLTLPSNSLTDRTCTAADRSNLAFSALPFKKYLGLSNADYGATCRTQCIILHSWVPLPYRLWQWL